MFDRDGVLTRFDMVAIERFFAPIVPLSIPEIAARWQRFCETNRSPESLRDEDAFWAAFWESVADELSLDAGRRQRLAEFDYTRVLRPHDDAEAAMRRARERGLKVGVLSNFPLASLERSLEAVGLLALADACCSAAVIGVAKPARGAYEAVAQRLDVSPSECVFFDDEAPCVEGALATEMDAYLVDRRGTAGPASPRAVASLAALDTILDAALPGR